MKTFSISLRREQISEFTLDFVIEAPTLEAALKAAPKVAVSDLDWQLYDFRWADEPPTVAEHGKAKASDIADYTADASGNLLPKTPAPSTFRPRLVAGDE